MYKVPQMIMIGSNAKNSGKTWLSTFLIKKFSQKYNLISLKAKFIYSENDSIHIESPLFEENGFVIYEESVNDLETDTSKMLQAGSKKAYFLQSRIEVAQKAVDELVKLFEKDYLVVCESNTLINWLEPSLFVICSSLNAVNVKSDVDKMIQKAGLLIHFDGKKFDFAVENIYFSSETRKWDFSK